MEKKQLKVVGVVKSQSEDIKQLFKKVCGKKCVEDITFANGKESGSVALVVLNKKKCKYWIFNLFIFGLFRYIDY
jgi:hypothetical protein